MKYAILGAAFACLAATFTAAPTPATAQEMRMRMGPDGVVVRTDRPRRFQERRYYGRPAFGPQRRTTTVRELPNGCQLVTVRTRRGDGTVVVRRFRRC